MGGSASFFHSHGHSVAPDHDGGGVSKMDGFELDAVERVQNGVGGSEDLFRVLQERPDEEGGHVSIGFRWGWRR